MRIARFTTGEDPQYGVVTGELDEYGQPDEDSVVVALAGDPLYVGIKLLEEQYRLADVRLLAPVLPRSKVVGIGRNYAAHAAEMGNDVPDEPLMFLKPNTSVVGPGDPIFYPPQTSDLHYEGELAVVIGRICRDVPAEQATDVIHGYTIANDVTARDLQKQRRAVHPGQGLRLVLPAGTVDRDRPRPATTSARDGACRPTSTATSMQDGTTADLIFDIPTLVAHVTSVMTLLPGDVILTGTPEGVGPMEVGDEVEVSIAGIGSLTNMVARR